MKKTISIFLAVLLLVIVLIPSEALAASSEYCDVTGCKQSKKHTHKLCNKAGCTKTKNHTHNGKIYYGHSKNDGHAYHKCGAPGCKKTKEHSHNCGNGHNSGGHSGGHHKKM